MEYRSCFQTSNPPKGGAHGPRPPEKREDAAGNPQVSEKKGGLPSDPKLKDRDSSQPPTPVKTGRNLVVCIDGTSNQFGSKNTNIIELYSQLVKDETQLTYYNSGIGTYAKPSRKTLGHWRRVLDNKIDLAIAWNFDRIVKGAYRWLAENYQKGDVIYLFGFSRGAYQVRALAAMIRKVGLIHKGNEEQIAYAYALYADPNSDKPPKEMPAQNHATNLENQGNAAIAKETRPSSVLRKLKKMISRDAPTQAKGAESVQKGSQERLSMAARFKQTFSRKGVQVHFVGAWDTVSSVGLFRDKNLPGTDDPSTACYFRHALALDERRVKFLPEYARGGTTSVVDEEPQVQGPRERDAGGSEGEDSEITLLRKESKTEASQGVKEVWFSGTHSDIGGGNVDNQDLNRRHPSSLWMFYEAISMGLKLEPTYVEWRSDDLGNVKESLTGVWTIMEYLPIKRLSYHTSDSVTWRWHRGKGRSMQQGQKIHASVAFCHKGYLPKAHLPRDIKNKWEDLIGTGEEDDMDWTEAWEGLLELDIFDPKAASTLVDKLQDSPDHNSDIPFWIHRLNTMVGSYEGRRSLRTVVNVLERLLRSIKLEWEATKQVVVLNAVRSLADGIPDVRSPLEQPADLPEILNNVLKNTPQDSDEGHLKTVAIFVAKFHEVDWCKDFFESRVISAMSTLLEDSTKQSEWAEILITIHNEIKDRDFIWELLLLSPRIFDNISSIMLSSSKPSMCLTGLFFMHYVARHGKYDAMLDVRFVTGLLTNTYWRVREKCLEVVGLFIRDPLVRCDMLEKGLGMQLLDRLSDEDSDVRESSSRVLGELIKFSIADGTIDQILNATLWTALSAMLKDDNSDVRRAGLVLIDECSEHDVFRHAMLANEAPIKVLLTHEGSDRGRYLQTSELLVRFRDTRSFILKESLMDILLETLRDISWRTRESSLRVIRELIKSSSAEEEIHIQILGGKLWAMLLNTLNDDDLDVCEACLAVIEECSKCGIFCNAMVAKTTPITALLTQKDSEYGYRLKAIGFLVRDGNTRLCMMQNDLMITLRDALCSDAWRVRMSSLDVLRELIGSSSDDDTVHNQILDNSIWSTILKTSNDEDEDVRQACTSLFNKCSKHDAFLHAMVANVTPIITLLTYEHPDGGSWLPGIGIFVRDKDIRSIMMKNDLLDMLGNMLRDDAKHLRAPSLDVICGLIKSSSADEGIIDQILDTDFWTTVLSISNGSDSNVCQSYANLFEEFSDNAVLCDAMVAKMTPIIALLNHEDPDISCRLPGIKFLVRDRRIRTILVQNNLIAILQDTLRHDGWGVRKSSLEVVQELLKSSTTEEGIHDQILNSALWTSLPNVLNDDDSDVREACLDLIKESSQQDVFCHEMVASGEPIISLLAHTDYDVKRRLTAIKVLVRERSVRSYMVQNHLIAILCDVLRDDNWIYRMSGLEVMQELVKSGSDSEDIRDRIPDGSVWISVLKVLDDEDSDVRRASVDLIKECSKHEAFCRAMVANATPIIKLLEGLHSHGRLQSVALLLRDRSIRACMVKNNLITILRDTLRDGDWDVRASRLDVIRELISSSSVGEGVRGQILASAIWTSLPSVLRDDDDDVRKACLSLIEECSKHDSFRRAMVTVNNGRTTALKKLNLPKVLRDDYEKVRRQCRMTLVELAKYDVTRNELRNIGLEAEQLPKILHGSKRWIEDPDASESEISAEETRIDQNQIDTESKMPVGEMEVAAHVGEQDPEGLTADSDVVVDSSRVPTST